MRCIVTAIAVLLTVAGSLFGTDASTSGDFYIAPEGNDDNAGTRDKPFATLARARNAVRERIAAELKDDVTVLIRGNHLHDVRRSLFAQGAPNNGMFIDQGSKGYLFERNVIYNTSAELVRFNQCARDWHTWRDNHFGEEADVKKSGNEIIAASGLEEPYRRRRLGQGGTDHRR